MSANTFEQSNDYIPSKKTNVTTRLVKEINKTRKTIAALKADGHITEDAERHFSELNEDLSLITRRR